MVQMTSQPTFEEILTSAQHASADDVPRLVDSLLRAAQTAGASDLHLQPSAGGLAAKWRVDGCLQSLGMLPAEIAGNIVVRLKVMARLLTYQTALPQEGRITQHDLPFEVRVSTFPTVHGEKVVARLLPTGERGLLRLADLGLAAEASAALRAALSQTSGMLLIVGPAGSGKTTTAYACLRELLATDPAPRNIVSMEDPVEVLIEGVTQSEVAPAVGLDLTSGLRSLVRQDPDVIFVGEIRDPATASIAFQAALTGQLVITTFHAPDAASAISRLADMGVPDYVLRSATNCVLGQRLLRRLCSCAVEGDDQDQRFGLPIDHWRMPGGCAACQHVGYVGRNLLTERFDIASGELSRRIQAGVDAQTLREAAQAQGMKSLYDQALLLVASGEISPAELVRVFGIAPLG